MSEEGTSSTNNNEDINILVITLYFKIVFLAMIIWNIIAMYFKDTYKLINITFYRNIFLYYYIIVTN